MFYKVKLEARTPTFGQNSVPVVFPLPFRGYMLELFHEVLFVYDHRFEATQYVPFNREQQHRKL